MTPPALVLDGDLTRDLADALLETDMLAVDTETSGLSWRDDRLLLCQLFTPATGPVLVRNMTNPPAQLARVLGSPRVTKVFHFAPFDLRFLQYQLGISTANVACTKAASKILDPHLPRSDHSLAQLASRYLGITLEKGAVRTSDWGTTVLTGQQIDYATADVVHLPSLLNALTQRLLSANQLDNWRAACNYMPIDAHFEVSDTPNPLTY